jgi:drug/metabolite transporter (DMT)-like permease
MQAVRTAGQKQLSHHLNAMATTLVRFLFAVPFVWIYLFSVSHFQHLAIPEINSNFIQSAFLAAIAQIAATAFVIMAFRYQNFAVATSLVKTEAVLTAIMGVLVFDAMLSGFGWLSVIIGVLGVLILSKTDVGLKSIFNSPASAFGIAAGLGFAMATLWIRQASLALQTDLLLSAAFTLAFMVTLQTFIVFIYVLYQDKNQFRLIINHWRISAFVGIASMLGSIGWFTAASLQTAAYVKALGQVEFFFTLIITYRVFKEHINLREYIGMSLIVLSVVILLLLA